jgi:hypothetical protein
MEMEVQTDPADILRERVSTYICSKYQLPAFVLHTRKGLMVLCCCKQFADRLKADFETIFKDDVQGLKITFGVGSVDYL